MALKNANDKAIYLKVNINKYFSLTCIQFWLNLAAIYDARLYIICEKPEIITEISKNCRFGSVSLEEYARARKMENDPLFVGAYFDKLTDFAKRLVKPGWVKAAVSHLTTFQHAAENGFKSFWNIDADDTLFFTPSETGLKEAFQKVESVATDYDCVSLDMWNSLNRGQHWSFGVAYIHATSLWQNILESNIERVHTVWKEINLPERVHNLDYYFTSLSTEALIKTFTFYINKASFCHYGIYLAGMVIYPGMGLNYWSDKMIIFPILNISVPIADSTVKIDINSSDLPLPPVIKDNNIQDQNQSLKKIYIKQLNNSLKLSGDSFIYTYHDTFISYDCIGNRFYHGNKLIDHVTYTIIGDKIYFSYNDKYITYNPKASIFQLTSSLNLFDIIYNDDGTISIKIGNKFLTAWENGAMILMPHCLEWERFYI